MATNTMASIAELVLAEVRPNIELAKTEPQTEPQTEPRREVKGEAKIDVKEEAKAEVKTEAKADIPNDPDFAIEVLQLPLGKTETEAEEELLARASALGISTAPRPPPVDEKRNTSSAESASTAITFHARTFSTASNGSISTAITSHSSIFDGPIPATLSTTTGFRTRVKALSFSQYDKYLAHLDPNINQPKFLKEPPQDHIDVSGQSLFSVRTKRSFFSIKNGIKNRMRWRKKGPASTDIRLSCICCRDDFNKSSALHTLPCGHTYCGDCLRVMITQATTDESKMPPRCCTQPIPSSIVKTLLTKDEQQLFLKSVLQFSTPWEARIFCPNTSCGEFILPRTKIDPKHPFDIVCRKCKSKVCIMCKRDAHQFGQDCPSDWELEAVLKMGEKSGWRRCYKCRTLVELSHGCTHMTCRCKAQFCYICGAVWDPSVGCPNFCNGDEEMERRRLAEEARIAELEAEKAAARAAAAREAAEAVEAEKRTRESPEFEQLGRAQLAELERFRDYQKSVRWLMWTRHSAKKSATVDRYSDQMDKMKERHAKTVTHLEDRQLAAEVELRASLKHTEKSVNIRLRHMEAYCHGLGRNGEPGLPGRVVTERDLRELGQQYHLRDGMARLHQAKINVMRDRQAKRMEELLERQEQEMQKLQARRDAEVENLASEFAADEDALAGELGARRQKLVRRWELSGAVLRKEQENEKGARFAPIPLPAWPDENEGQEEPLPAVQE